MSEGREDVDITGFEGDIVISLSIVGRGEHFRTSGAISSQLPHHSSKALITTDL